ncbi:MAG: alkyl hydroperoxide reductase, partial [Acidobacteriota bacterium]
MAMVNIENLRESLPESAKDTRLNLQNVFMTTTLTPNQLWGTAIAAALATRNGRLAGAVLRDAHLVVDANVTEDGK